MVCVAQYLTARFLPYNDMKEQFEFWLLFYLSAEAIPSNFLAFPLTDEFFFSYSFLSLLIFLLLSYHLTFLIFLIFASLIRFLIIYFLVLFLFSYVVHSTLSHLYYEAFTFLIYFTEDTHTKL